MGNSSKNVKKVGVIMTKKKWFLFGLLLLFIGSVSYYKWQPLRVKYVTIEVPSLARAQFYLADNGSKSRKSTKFYWGCINSLVPWKSGLGLEQVFYGDKKITLIRVRNADEQTALSMQVLELISKDTSTKKAFEMTFNTYRRIKDGSMRL